MQQASEGGMEREAMTTAATGRWVGRTEGGEVAERWRRRWWWWW